VLGELGAGGGVNDVGAREAFEIPELLFRGVTEAFAAFFAPWRA
jgi:hypothetical protein